MENKQNNEAYARELTSLIASGIKSEEAKKIADSHYGNYSKVAEEIAKERESCRKKSKLEKQEYAKAAQLTARIKAGENPQSAYQDMYEKEL